MPFEIINVREKIERTNVRYEKLKKKRLQTLNKNVKLLLLDALIKSIASGQIFHLRQIFVFRALKNCMFGVR